MERKRQSIRWWFGLLMLVLLACTCGGLPSQVLSPTAVVETKSTPTIGDTLPTATQPPPTATSNATPITATATQITGPQFNANGVRICDYVPGVSVPAQMPSDVVNITTPTPYPTPTEPPNSTVDAATTQRQLKVF